MCDEDGPDYDGQYRQRISKNWLTAVLSVLLLVTAGCGNKPKHHNFSHITLDEPIRKSFKDPNADFGRLGKFVLFRFAGTETGQDINAIEESQMLYVLTNLLLLKGYECVEKPEDADFIVGIRYTNEYKETYIPPRQVTLPRYMPGGTSQTYSNFSGYAGNTYVWGSGTATTHHPGTWTTDTVTVGGYNVGFFYPFVLVTVVDAKTKSQVWQGSTIGASKTADVRLTGQFLLAKLLGHEFPLGPSRADSEHGTIGVTVLPFSRDGNTYYPTVVQVQDKGPAKKAGIKEYDQIIAVNSNNTGNTTASEWLRMLGKPGDKVQLRIQREDKVLEKEIVLVQRPPSE